MEKKYQVFVSSTYTDLQEERMAVFNALLDNNCIPVGMEQFPATSISQWELIKKMIIQCDYYLLIIAGRYGSIEKDTGISYTEKEFMFAKDSNIPIMCFLRKDPQCLPVNLTDADDNSRKKLHEFRSKVENSGIHVNYYTDKLELKYNIAKSIPSIIKDCPRVGWIRADQVEDVLQNSEYISELKKLQQVVTGLQNIIDKKLTNISPQWHGISEEEARDIAKQVLDENTASDKDIQEMLDSVFGKSPVTIDCGNSLKIND